MDEFVEHDVPFFDNKCFFKNNDNIYIQLSTDFPEYVGVLHKHQFIEIVYILSGSAIHTVGRKEYEVKSGDVILINCSIPHKFTSASNSNEAFVAYDLMFSPDFFDSVVINMGDFESLRNCFLFNSLFPSDEAVYPDMHISGKGFASYGSIFAQIYQEFGRRRKGYIQIIRAYVIELIIKIFRDVEKDGNFSLPADKRDAVEQAIKYIKENYNIKLSVDEVAEKVFLGTDYFRKIFKTATGNSVTAFQQKLRIDEACRLLLTTELPIKSVCDSVGYNDITTFYQAFKKVTGKTPKEYRITQ